MYKLLDTPYLLMRSTAIETRYVWKGKCSMKVINLPGHALAGTKFK